MNFSSQKNLSETLALTAFILACVFCIGHASLANKVILFNVRNGIFLSVLLFFLGASYLLKKKKLEKWLYSLPLFLVFTAGASQGLISFCLFLGCSYIAGDWLNDRSKLIGNSRNLLERFILLSVIGSAVLVAIDFILIHLPINFPWLYKVLSIVIIFRGRKRISSLLSRSFSQPWQIDGLRLVTLFFVIIHLTYALLPIYGWEDINVYMYIPKTILERGRWYPNVDFVNTFANVGTYPLYVMNQALSGETGIRLLLIGYFTGSFLLMEALLRRSFAYRTALLGQLTFILIPYFSVSSSRLYNDFIDLLFGVSILITYLEQRDRNANPKLEWILGFFFLLSISFMIRMQTIIISAPFSCLVLWAGLRDGQKRQRLNFLKNFFAGVFLFLAINSVWLLRNYFLTGNPLFPWFNQIFKSPYFDIKGNILKDALGTIPKSPLEVIFDLTFKFNRQYLYTFVDQYGFGFFLFIATITTFFAIFNAKFRRRHRWLFFAVYCSFLIYYCFFLQARYLYAAIPLQIFLFCTLTELIFNKYNNWIIVGLFTPLLMVQTIAQQSLGKMNVPIWFVLSDVHQNREVQYWDKIKKFFSMVNTIVKKEDKILISYAPYNFFCDCDIVGNEWYFYRTHMKIVDRVKETGATPKAMYDLLFKELNFKGLIITNSGDYFSRLITSGLIKKEVSHEGLALYFPVTNKESSQSSNGAQLRRNQIPLTVDYD